MAMDFKIKTFQIFDNLKKYIYSFPLFYFHDGYYFPKPATAVMDSIIEFHNDIMFYLIITITIIFLLLAVVILNFSSLNKNREFGYASKINHHTNLEII
jgi:heme/copper-type cytochrome/quinol oxidase subunit 2